jgi:hypothetical protein
MPLARFDTPFEHPDWIFEPKLFGVRAAAYLEGNACRMVRSKADMKPSKGAQRCCAA